MRDPLLAVDTPWLLYRAFFALPRSISGADGKPANALLGTVNAILAAVEACRPRAVVAAFGAEEAAYRVELYPRYHAHRDPMPAELAAQWARAPALLGAFGWTVFDGGDLEADDVLHSVARAEVEAGGRALLLTADRDLLQAAEDRVAIIARPPKGEEPPELTGPTEVKERHGVEPGLIPDLIALRGDPSDGLPGAPGIGAKTAADLLRRHGSLEAALDAADGERPRVAAALRDHRDELLAYKAIATLRRIEGIEAPPDRATDRPGGAAAAAELGLRRLAARLAS